MVIGELGAGLKRFRMAICLVATVSIILVNVTSFHLSVVGVGASLTRAHAFFRRLFLVFTFILPEIFLAYAVRFLKDTVEWAHG